MKKSIRTTKPDFENLFAHQEANQKDGGTSYAAKLLEYNINPEEIREYELNSQYLRTSTLELLAAKNVSKKFFIQAGNPKTRLINDLRAVNYAENQIERIVSIAVEMFLDEFEKNGKVNNWKNLSRFFIEEEQREQQVDAVIDTTFKYVPPPLFNIQPKKVTEKQLRHELLKIHKDFGELIERKSLGTKATVIDLKSLIVRLGKEIFNCQKLEGMNTKKKSKKGGEVRNEPYRYFMPQLIFDVIHLRI